MRQIIDLTHKTFGYLEVLKRADDYITPKGQPHARWLCICKKCGHFKIVTGYNLKNGSAKSCGCLQKKLISDQNKKHGLYGTKIYKIWQGIKCRCYDKNHSSYNYYGGRGIIMCDEWLSVETFSKWAYDNGFNENAEKGQCTIDRIDVNGNYCPENCRWVDMKVQSRNKRNNHLITYNGETHCISEWEDIYNVRRNLFCERLSYGWSIERIFTNI